MLTNSTTSDFSMFECPPNIIPLVDDKPIKWKLNHIEIAPNCPRCASSNTKFCYYNNYSLSQPRYFCKGCRRYWTKGGSLRNVPVGGGCRKSRRSRAAARHGSSTSAAYSPGSAGSSGETENGTSASDIDLAAVFANYVNQNVEENNNEESFSPGDTSNSGSLDHIGASSLDIESDISTMFHEYQKPIDLINIGFENELQQMLPPQISMHQDFVYQNSDAFQLLGDESTADILWSDDHTNLPNFGSQHEFQDFGLFSPDDELKNSANLVTDNWGSFDLSAYEMFSRP